MNNTNKFPKPYPILHHCCIYTPYKKHGLMKLLEIIKEKAYKDISVVDIRLDEPTRFRVIFSDDEEWNIVNPYNHAIGRRWQEVWVDAPNVSYEILKTIIEPSLQTSLSNPIHFFNYEYLKETDTDDNN